MAKSGMPFKGRELFIAVSRPKGGGARGGLRGRGRSFRDSYSGLQQHCLLVSSLQARLSCTLTHALRTAVIAMTSSSADTVAAQTNKQETSMLNKVSEPSGMQAGGSRGEEASEEAGEVGAEAKEGTQGTANGRWAAIGVPLSGKARALGITLCM